MSEGPSPTTTADFDLAAQAADALVARLGRRPDLALVLGSGWRPVADALGPVLGECDMEEVPGFPVPKVAGHQGTLRMMEVGNRTVLVLLGRAHLYEGWSPAQVAHPVRAAVLAGAGVVVLTNAAGAVNPEYAPGQVVLVRDHINLMAASPLAGGGPPDRFRSRFVDLTYAYSRELREVAMALDPTLSQGVYAALRGPHYETPAEIAMLRAMGADLVGMSTVLETIAARHLGAWVLGLSLVTNLAAGVSPEPLDHAQVLAAGAAAVPRVSRLLGALLPELPLVPA